MTIEAGPSEPRAPESRLHRAEDSINLLILAIMAFLPLAEILGRRLGGLTLPGSQQYVAMLTLWIGFTGAILATREQRHLAISAGAQLSKGKTELVLRFIATVAGVTVSAVLTRGAFAIVAAEMDSVSTLPGGIPSWTTQAIMPLGYAIITVRLALVAFPSWTGRALVLGASLPLLALGWLGSDELAAAMRWPGMIALLVATAAGAPLYACLGGAALVLFWADGTPVAAVAAETVRQIASPTMPTIPLFTFAGYMLAESKTSARLVRMMDALVGWLPGGLAVLTAGVCAFFTTFTGASGVTILALGGILFPMLVKERYPEKFSVGLLTASGSIGLLFPPSLPVIFYGVIAGVAVDKLFVAGAIPGLILVIAVSAYGALGGIRAGATRSDFDLKEVISAANEAKWELVLPLVVIVGIVSGLATLVEAAALTAAYAIFIETVIYKDLSLRDLPRVARECATLVGGVLIILGVAMGFTSYLIDADVPTLALDWVKGGIETQLGFLLALNGFLLVVGCLMDIYSAIVVVAPLILPIARHYGVDELHLGIIFLANLELGFLTPPVGMNLFLASFRFKRPLSEVYRVTFPFLVILLVAVLLITYWPWLTLAPVRWVFGATQGPA
ncbi:MAG: TRAP transporter large permease subunit [Deltaproteobacteria bacterium]|nr:TRAP transporter large permease subunit [Deltaproteobacteria bacterium]